MNSFNPFSLEGKTILVTGASSGIGRGIAIACSRMGARVIINCRNDFKLSETLSLMEGEDHIKILGDLICPKDVQVLIDNLPKLDGIVYSAGIGHRLLTKMMSEDELDRVLNVNFKSPVLLQAGITKAKKLNKGASVVFIASIAYNSPYLGNAAYSASKGALVAYSNCLALELAPRAIRVNCISPAMVWTDLIYNEGDSKESLEQDERTYPLKRYGQPEDIANLAIYLLSDASSWMTGNNIRITGGLKNS